MSHFNWSGERIDLLISLWPIRSAGQIAARLGVPCTRNSVIGKAHRLGLTKPPKKRVAPVVKTQEKAMRASKPVRTYEIVPAKPSRTRFVKTATVAPSIIPTRAGCFDLADRTGVPLLSLRSGMCRWPLGEKPFLFCAAVTPNPEDPNCSYCYEHAEIAYASTPALTIKVAA